jgi:CRISPR/Cas system CMR-associated protein Cmr5 small subunit
MPAILVLERLRQEDHEFQASPGFLGRTCLKTKQNKKNQGSSGSLVRRIPLMVSWVGLLEQIALVTVWV